LQEYLQMGNTQTDDPKLIIVIGASAGGLHSVVEVCAQLNQTINAAVFIVLHLTKLSSRDVLTYRIQKNTAFTCKMAEHNDTIKQGYVYIAVPDKHLVIKKNKIILGEGPPENRWRPSIDVLFRSAAAAYDGKVVGIILTGLMQDGTSGMLAIKRCGGTCIVQDPKEAEYPDMPLSVLNAMEVDYSVPLIQMGAILEEKSRNGIYESHGIPEDIRSEAEIAERVALGIETVKAIGGDTSTFTCPDCGGVLFEMMSDDITRYRCHTGHVYNQLELSKKQNEALENTLWIALRMLEERKSLLEKMSGEEKSKGWNISSVNKKERAAELNEHIERLKKFLFDTKQEG
jgi:two-component system, chemotaxis family, protein-glutamate methylesterase/glutaminase